MSTAARRRLMRDFKRMQTDPPAGVSASPIADNVMTWYAYAAVPTRKAAVQRHHTHKFALHQSLH